MDALQSIAARIAQMPVCTHHGRVAAVRAGLITVEGLGGRASVGDRVSITRDGPALMGEVVGLGPRDMQVLPEGPVEGLSVGAEVLLLPAPRIAPCDAWIGRIIDPFGNPLDGRPLIRGGAARAFRADPPPAAGRRRLGARLATGLAVFDTLLPLVAGQRIGLFAGSGVGKSTLLAQMARGVQADVVVIAMIGERGRELREFVERTMGPEGMARTVVVAATSDQSPLLRRRCAWAAMAVAEHFRDQGRHVLFLADSITRFAEAHREIALSAGEAPSYRGFPPSVSNLIMALAERSGPGPEGSGDITAIFSVLVAGSDMEEPVADILRGTLDGHVVLDRTIAERGRFPAVDVVRSVSRSLPDAATGPQNALIGKARAALGAYAESELMIRAGLHAPGSDPRLDEAVRLWPGLDDFVSQRSPGVDESFEALGLALRSGRRAGNRS
ncbi:FliI/YscN family ATPase [Paracoccus sp. 1_MG-2023]|uniref:FliI/YscN family ATPase n=1 Tax=unclassified Paracoccus (in: a-proteobacteria) TaxID=2688777 RepID=UPI001C087A39|nr:MULTISPECIES: FliI/YscN family ATPase [unclassified Paracoccus (in: a-proteobacteria)]MBU2956895.1 FliI/YscN family ATPase [Paracoccus sp. C2R09]MDO6668093.1 FliI/YscN family ATPase [Paracoccus sp. 1_MG-2023]